MKSRQFPLPTAIDPQWIETRGVHPLVAAAIHATAWMNPPRSADSLWADPTDGALYVVRQVMREYLAHGDFEPAEGDRYQWDDESWIDLKATA